MQVQARRKKSKVEYRIHPSIGIARLGNSPDEFYLAPVGIGQRPIKCNTWGEESFPDDNPQRFVSKYKDLKGRVKRQAAKFWVYRYDDEHPHGKRVELGNGIEEISWTVHLANKKAAWYEFSEYEGNLMFGDQNSYENRGVSLRNSDDETPKQRQKLIIDAGPRTITGPHEKKEFTAQTAPSYYKAVSFPKKPKIGFRIRSLGEIRTDSKGNLIVLGGFGNSGGDEDVESYGGADTWHDDISDGYVKCHIKTKENPKGDDLEAWVIVGSPDFSPEIVNISTLDDVMFDVAVRKKSALPSLFDRDKEKKWGSDFEKYYRDATIEACQDVIKKYGTKKCKKELWQIVLKKYDFEEDRLEKWKTKVTKSGIKGVKKQVWKEILEEYEKETITTQKWQDVVKKYRNQMLQNNAWQDFAQQYKKREESELKIWKEIIKNFRNDDKVKERLRLAAVKNSHKKEINSQICQHEIKIFGIKTESDRQFWHTGNKNNNEKQIWQDLIKKYGSEQKAENHILEEAIKKYGSEDKAKKEIHKFSLHKYRHSYDVYRIYKEITQKFQDRRNSELQIWYDIINEHATIQIQSHFWSNVIKNYVIIKSRKDPKNNNEKQIWQDLIKKYGTELKVVKHIIKDAAKEFGSKKEAEKQIWHLVIKNQAENLIWQNAIRIHGTRKNAEKHVWKWGWNPNYPANFKRDIKPIIERPGGYRWVANVPSMLDFISPKFDVTDKSNSNKPNRQRYFSYWRQPGYIDPGFGGNNDTDVMHDYGQRTKAFSNDEVGQGIPLMPINSGSNVLTDQFVDKFATLTKTQYRLLLNWANGKFTLDDEDDYASVHELDRASVGNCVGIPMCPGIEVTWTANNPHLYRKPYQIKHKKIDTSIGLDPFYDETDFVGYARTDGCEPGDLTKRMANPWQSDLFQCNVDYVTFHDDSDNYNRRGKEVPIPPTFVAYWWPPSAPWDVMAGIEDKDEQKKAGWISAGKQVRYTRGIGNILEMVYGWSYLGFIVNQNNNEEERAEYPYFVEKERNHDKFGIMTTKWNLGVPNYTDSTYEPIFYLKTRPKLL